MEFALIQLSPNKWNRSNEIQYSYGWLGVKCQLTTNFVLAEDGRGKLGRFDTMWYGNHFVIDELQASLIINEKHNHDKL
uniref:Uncharacterized protein n=1 Tax=Wuchereria bancrofti TaxID=6293 RepID=A0A1I8EYH4_WUCBA